MIKNCVFYKLSDEVKEWNINRKEISNSDLVSCLDVANARTKKKLNALIALTQKEKISLEKETNQEYVIDVSTEFRARRFIAAGKIPTPFIPVNYKIWLRKNSSWAISFEAGRKLSSVGISLLSFALTDSPSMFENIKLERDNFINLKDWTLSQKHGISGHIQKISLRNAQYDSIKFKQIILNSPGLEASKLFSGLTDSAQSISELSLITPPIPSTSRQIKCKINHWGGLTIYTPDMMNSELSDLIEIFENQLKI